jgi:hypothetical protein
MLAVAHDLGAVGGFATMLAAIFPEGAVLRDAAVALRMGAFGVGHGPPQKKLPGLSRLRPSGYGGQADPAHARETYSLLDDRTSSSCGKMNNQQDDPDDEENPGDLRSHRRDASGAEHPGNQPDDEKHKSVIKHGNLPFVIEQIAEGVPFWIPLTNQ